MTKLHGQFHIVKLTNVDVICHTHPVKEKSPVIILMAARKDSANFIYCLLEKKKDLENLIFHNHLRQS